MATEACCFIWNRELCSELEPQDCIDAGGLPRGPGTACFGTGTPGESIVCAREACCFDEGIPGEPHLACLDGTPLDCQEISSGEPMGWGTRCAVNFDCNDRFDDVRCCLADGTEHVHLSSNQCLAIGGSPIDIAEECPPVDFDDQCRRAEPDSLPPGARRWDQNVCQNAILSPTKRPDVHVPDPGDDSARFFSAGYFEFVTRWPVRAMSLPASDFGESCQHHYAPVTIDDDGYGVGLLCGDRAIPGATRSPTVALLANDDRFGPQGYAVFAAAYQAPLWTEVIFDSPLLTCGEIPR